MFAVVDASTKAAAVSERTHHSQFESVSLSVYNIIMVIRTVFEFSRLSYSDYRCFHFQLHSPNRIEPNDDDDNNNDDDDDKRIHFAENFFLLFSYETRIEILIEKRKNKRCAYALKMARDAHAPPLSELYGRTRRRRRKRRRREHQK